jgi:hypothetical protein
MACTAASPTPLIAPSPKRMLVGPATRNAYCDSFTSGGSTVSFMLAHSSIRVTTLSVLSMSEDSTAAMNAAG